MSKIKYYKFDIGNGAMRKNGGIVEYLDPNGNWVENRALLRKFIGGDTDFDEISFEDAEKLIHARKNNTIK